MLLDRPASTDALNDPVDSEHNHLTTDVRVDVVRVGVTDPVLRFDSWIRRRWRVLRQSCHECHGGLRSSCQSLPVASLRGLLVLAILLFCILSIGSVINERVEGARKADSVGTFNLLLGLLRGASREVVGSARPATSDLYDRREEAHMVSPPKRRYRYPYRMVLCTMVSDAEIVYLPEWIEFHALQGVDKFALYHQTLPSNPRSVLGFMQLQVLAAAYRARSRRRHEAEDFGVEDDLVEVLPAPLLVPDLVVDTLPLAQAPLTFHRQLQPAATADCLERYRNLTKYILHSDPDEFIYSPSFTSAYDFLEDLSGQIRRGELQRDKEPVGVTVASVSYGPSRRFWDLNTRIVPDLNTGTYQLYFDPRDSTLFRFLRSQPQLSRSPETHRHYESNQLSNLNAPIPLAEAAASITARLKELREAELSTDVFASPGKAALLQSAEALLRSLYPTEKNNVHLFSPESHHSESLRHLQGAFQPFCSISKRAPREERGFLLDAKAAWLECLCDRINDERNGSSIESLLESAVAFFPLVIEEQIRRPPRQILGDAERAAETWRLSITECQFAQNKTSLMQALVEREGSSLAPEQLERTATTLMKLCTGGVHEGLTVNGKNIYFTEALKPRYYGGDTTIRSSSEEPPGESGPAEAVKKGQTGWYHNGVLRGCHRPGVHRCQNLLPSDQYLFIANPRTELRLDHHQFRSLHRRTLSLESWRKSTELGLFSSSNFTILERWLTASEDDQKLRFVAPIRQRLLRRFKGRVIPRFMQYDWNDNTQTLLLSPQFHRCSFIELRAGAQEMCPASHPYAGYRPLAHNLVTTPYGWCSNVTMTHPTPPSENIARAGDESLWLPNNDIVAFKNEASWTQDQLDATHARRCGAYGERRCCDFDEAARNVSARIHHSEK